MASMLMSTITKSVLGACCNDGGLFNNIFKDDGAKPEEEKKEDNWDPQFKRNFLNQDMKFELTEWKKLPIKARKAAEALGYTEEKWNGDESVDADWEHWWDLTEAQKKNLEILGWEETAWESKYEHTAWSDLPKKQQKAAKTAGYTEESWEHGGWLENLEKSWDDLSKKDREAMCVLGWTKHKWDE